MMNGVMGHADIRVAVFCEGKIAAIGVAGPAGEIAAGDVDTKATPSLNRVVDLSEGDGETDDLSGCQSFYLVRAASQHGAGNTIHQKLGFTGRSLLDQLCNEVRVWTVGRYMQIDTHRTRDRHLRI